MGIHCRDPSIQHLIRHARSFSRRQYGGLGFVAGQVVLVVIASVLAFNAVRFDRNIGSTRQPESDVEAEEAIAKTALATRASMTNLANHGKQADAALGNDAPTPVPSGSLHPVSSVGSDLAGAEETGLSIAASVAGTGLASASTGSPAILTPAAMAAAPANAAIAASSSALAFEPMTL